MRTAAALLALAALASACAGGQGPPVTAGTTTRAAELHAMDDARHRVEMVTTPTHVGTIGVPLERVWALLPAVYADLGLAGAVIDAERRVYGVADASFRRRLAGTPLSRFLECGARMATPNADAHTVRLSVRTSLQPDGAAGTLVRTQVEASAREPGGSDPPVRCGTTTELERRIERRIAERIAGL